MKQKYMIISEAAVLSLAFLLIVGCQFSPEARKASSLLLSKTGSICVIHGDGASFAGYKTVKVGEITSDVGDKCEEVRILLHKDMIKQLKKLEMFANVHGNEPVQPGRKTLLVEGTIIDYEEGSRIRRVTTFGGEAFIVVRYTLRDAESGEVVAVLNSRGFLRDGLNFGGKIEDAVGVANKGTVKFIKERFGRA